MIRNKKVSYLLFLVLCVLGATIWLSISVQAKTSGNYEYTVQKDGTVDIIKYNGKTAGNVQIPATIDGKKVTRIGNYVEDTYTDLDGKKKNIYRGAFYEHEEIKNIVIPNGVKEIGAVAFESCINMESITIPSSVTKFENEAFCQCYKLKKSSPSQKCNRDWRSCFSVL